MPRSATLHALCVGEDTTIIDTGFRAKTPAGSLNGLDVLLGRLSGRAFQQRPGVVLLAEGAHTALGLPATLPRKMTTDHPALDNARGVGWHVSEIGPWLTFWRHDRPAIHVGVLPWLTPRTYALLDPDDLAGTLRRAWQFHHLTGVPYHGNNGGLAGISLLKDHHNGRGHKPFWKPRNWDAVTPSGIPDVELAPVWTSPTQPDPAEYPFQYAFDANKQYLAAGGNAVLAYGELRHRTGPRTIEHRNPPGYHEITVPEWVLADRLYHPAGVDAVPGERRWVTAPTLDLLAELADTHTEAYGYLLDTPVVHQSWTGEHSGRVLRAWAPRLRDALLTAETIDDDRLTKAIKGAYSHTIGMLVRPGARVHRPDWAHAVIALARCNAFRRILPVGLAGMWPVEIDRDAVWYPTSSPGPAAGRSESEVRPPGIPAHGTSCTDVDCPGNCLGGWKLHAARAAQLEPVR